MRSSHFIFVASLLCLTLNPSVIKADQRYLETWLNGELLPFLTNRLGRHPRLKGQPFEITTTNKNNAVGKTDGLSTYIRQKVVDQLQSVPGANLVLRPPIKPWHNGFNLLDIACENRDKATVRVIIELNKNPSTDELRIAVQAIDLAEKNWVRGFKKVWMGELTTREKRLMAKRVIDQNLLGSRALPFQSDQADLVASYLAENLSCLLKQTGESALKLSLPQPSENLPEFFQTTFQLLDHYLTRYAKIEITQQKTANVVLTSSIHTINPKLYQISVLLRSLDQSIRILGVGTETYVYFDKIPPVRTVRSNKSLIELFQLVTPKVLKHCQHKNPWQQGQSILTRTSRLASQRCFAINLKAAETARLYLLAQTDKGQITRLFPDSCNVLGLKGQLQGGEILKHQTIHAPLWNNGNKGYFQLDHQPGIESVYAIAVTDPKIEANLKQQIRNIPDLCVTQIPRKYYDKRFRKKLTTLAGKSHGSMEWLERSFIHVR